MGYTWERRKDTGIIHLNTSLLQSGDLIAVNRFGGISSFIQCGTGAHVNHVAVLNWEGDVLYVVESLAASYHANGVGVIKTEWNQWLDECYAAGCMVAWLPIKSEFASVYDNVAAADFYNSKIGLPYGWETTHSSWIDTVDGNWPPILNSYVVAPVFAILERFDATVHPWDVVKGFNVRLNTTDLTIVEIAELLPSLNMTFADLLAIPEQDEWLYDGESRYFCSGLIANIWEHAGLFNGYDINGQEFQPRDNFEIEFIDANYPYPPECDGPHCQIMGKWKLEFDHVGEIPIYDHMNDNCPS